MSFNKTFIKIKQLIVGCYLFINDKCCLYVGKHMNRKAKRFSNIWVERASIGNLCTNFNYSIILQEMYV